MKVKPNLLTVLAFIFVSTLIPICLLEWPVEAGGITAPQASNKQATAQAHRQAVKKPFNEEAVKAYLNTLPRDGDYFVIEGDLLFTEQELRDDLASKSSGDKPVDPTRELIVKVRDGEREFYKNPAQRDLTYAVARSSFPGNDSYEFAVKNMQEAARAWVDACKKCGIKFRHLAQHDASPNHQGVNFIVRYHNAGGKYIAAAFFPYDAPSRRYINLDPSYFSEALKLLAPGVLRHELGHTLGYRHEQLQDATPGCYQERANEPDGLWLKLTEYDSRSVMHYQCGLNAGGKLNPKLTLSSDDIAGHEEIYGLPTSDPAVGFTASNPTLDIYRRAYQQPFNEDAVKAYIATLPKDREYFVVEGDIRMTEQELRTYLGSKTLSSKPASPGGELLANVIGGEMDFYRNVSERTLTYAVDRGSFKTPDQYNAVVKEMKLAAQPWQEECKGCALKFIHLPQHDEAPSNEKVNFTVRYLDSGGAFIAAAFFPHDGPSRRFIDIDPSFFGADLKNVSVGVLRHEIGHTLGYRHEHIENIPGCRSEGGEWVRLTPYDRNSVMHYWCGDNENPLLELSEFDKKSHQKHYGITSAPSTGFLRERPEVIIRLEGGNVPENAAAVLSALNDLGLLPVDKHKVDDDETIDSIYKDKLDIPFFAGGLQKLAGALNRANYDVRKLKPGEILLYPKLDFSEYLYSIRLDQSLESDKRRLASLLATDAALLASRQDEPEKGFTRLTFRGFEVRVPLDSPEYFNRLRDKLKSIPSENLLIFNSKPTVHRGATVYASGVEPADKYMEKATKPPPLEKNVQGLIGSFSGLMKIPEGLDACTRGPACPEIVLVDYPVELHPDIAQAIKSGGSKSSGRPEIVENDHQIIELGIFNDGDHGTYMAGIIASQNNNYGLVGLHPGARITAVDWTELQNAHDKLANLIEERSKASGLQIYVFASSWPWPPAVEEDDRINSNPISKKLENLAPLWITAAGEEDAGPKDINTGFRKGPMSLGFLKNVLVVTAYKLDSQQNPQLLRDSNFSTHGLVHIAAPGKNIPSTVSVSKYGLGEGSSPATAFVAGVASAMVSKWDYYTSADRVKFRLQLTARPSLSGVDAKKVVAGVLDPIVALLDPNKLWLRNNDGDYHEASLNHWCGSTFQVINPATGNVFNDGTIPVDQIHRLYKDRNTNNWFVFTSVKNDDGNTLPGMLRRIGPGTLKVDWQANPATFKRADGTVYTTLSFSDLILTQGLPVGNCQIPPKQ